MLNCRKNISEKNKIMNWNVRVKLSPFSSRTRVFSTSLYSIHSRIYAIANTATAFEQPKRKEKYGKSEEGKSVLFFISYSVHPIKAMHQRSQHNAPNGKLLTPNADWTGDVENWKTEARTEEPSRWRRRREKNYNVSYYLI